MYLCVTLLCLTIVPGSLSYENIHKFMSPEEVQRVFHTNVDSVPEYEVVKLYLSDRIHKRDLASGVRLHIKAFGEDINLWLNPADSLLIGDRTPVYYANSSATSAYGVKFIRSNYLMKMIGKVFEDPKRHASLVIGKDEFGAIRVNGYVRNCKIIIKSIPRRAVEAYRRTRQISDDLDDSLRSPHHIVFKLKEAATENIHLRPVNETRLRQRFRRSVSSVPDVLYIEILLTVENSIIKAHHNQLYGLVEYLLAFCNGIDLKFRSLESPKIRIHISGIVLAMDANATPYISKYIVDEDTFNVTDAMTSAAPFYYKVRDTFPLGSYDVSLTLTRRAFGKGGAGDVVGQAHVGVICKRGDVDKEKHAVTIIRDNGTYEGASVAAHELGHLLGAQHDADDECNFGFLMSAVVRYTANTSDFSKCSIKQIQHQLEQHDLDCLFNKPRKQKKYYPKLMPGRLTGLAEQCKALGKGAPCKNKPERPNVCERIFCLNENNECQETGSPAVDGTPCNVERKDMFCLHEQCVSL